jgi:hypothetical protein
MFARISTTVLLAFALAALPLGAVAQPATSFVRLYTLQPVGIGARLAVTGSSIGKVLHTADGGSVFGFDINQNGTDGLLASARTVTPQGQVAASVETFDHTTAKITKVIIRTRTMDDFVTYGIFAGDVGLVQHDHVVGNMDHRSWRLLNPVTGGAFTGKWTPPNASMFLLDQVAVNQSTPTTAVFGSDFSGMPLLFSSNVAANTFGPVFQLDPNHFSSGDGPKLAIDTVNNRAVIATSPDGGTVGGQVPLIAMIDLATGSITQFNGVKIPPFNSGYVNGFAVDSATGVACTSTELDASVEFYKLSNGSGFAVGLPGANGSQFNTGEQVLNDPIHKLFLVVQPNGTVGPQGDSVIDVFNEKGRLVKSIIGFKAFGVTPQMAINPAQRTGFVMGPSDDALTQFSY